MECDYVPIESADVTTYSLPIQSSLIKDSNSMDSLRTTIMFVTFFIICVFAYFLIPTVYLAVLAKLIKDDAPPEKKKKVVLYMDYVLSFLLGGVGLILICVGAFSDPTKVENTGDLLLAGFAVSIIYIISYIIIQARKLGGGTFIPGVTYGKAAPNQEESEQPLQ
jgi:preprotein translocase subunit SecG